MIVLPTVLAASLRGGRGTMADLRRICHIATHPAIALSPRTKRSARPWHQASLAVACVLLLSGCAAVEKYSLTYRVWDTDEWRKFSEPAPNPNLALFEATNHAEVLVQYDAFSEKHARVERHTYYLQPHQPRVGGARKPEFVKPSLANGMKPIPVLATQGALTNQPMELAVYAVVTRDGRGFTLYRPMERGSVFDLPVYIETAGTPTRIVLTPFAVAGDTVMAGAAVTTVGCVAWAYIGAPTYW